MMLKRLAYIILCTAGILGAASCADTKDNPDVPVNTTDADKVRLVFTVSAADAQQSRATDKDNYFEPEASPYERMNTLRVLIVRPDGIVEINKVFNFDDDGVVISDKMEFEVVGGEKKNIYLLANCKDVTYNGDKSLNAYLNSLKPNTQYSGLDLENMIITADPTSLSIIDNTGENKKYIPITELYQGIEIVKGKPNTIERQDLGTLFITRAAVKFSFSVAAVNGGIALDKFEDYYVTGFEFENIANREFLLPRATYQSDKNGETLPNPGLEGQFITSYEIPYVAIHYPLQLPGYDAPIPRVIDEDKRLNWSLPVYFCESKYNPDEDKPYKLSMTVKAKDADGNWIEGSEYTFGPKELPNLSSLPRNTHVILHVDIWKHDMDVTVTLVPYIGVTLHPSFGF